MGAKEKQKIKHLSNQLDNIYSNELSNDTIDFHNELTYKVSNMIRMQRSISWVERYSVLKEPDYDLTFVLNWIALEALYGKEEFLPFIKVYAPNDKTTIKEIMQFITGLEKIEVDRQHLIDAVSDVFSDVQNIFANPYIDSNSWYKFYHTNKTKKSKSKENVFELAKQSTPVLRKKVLQDTKQFNEMLRNLFSRLYLLRNQLLHGNATYKGGLHMNARIAQIENAAVIVKTLIPVIIQIMLDSLSKNPESKRWGLIPYPRITSFVGINS